MGRRGASRGRHDYSGGGLRFGCVARHHRPSLEPPMVWFQSDEKPVIDTLPEGIL